MEYTFENLNIASIILGRELLRHGKARDTRGTKRVELPEPVLIHITNPTDRYLNMKVRKHHKVLPFAESLALASGVNEMGLYAGYVPSMMNYSDDGEFQRAGYGPRIRAFTGNNSPYFIDSPYTRHIYTGQIKVVDQLKFVIETLKKDINSLQAVISISDPAKDCFDGHGNLLVTKDQPCSRSLQFTVNDGKLDCTLHIRSNDYLFGFQAVNVFNFTFMQEYVANILGLQIGVYHHFATNFHYYEDKVEMVKSIADLDMWDYTSEFGVWQYKNEMQSLNHFDDNVNDIFTLERSLRGKKGVDQIVAVYSPEDFTDFFGDWVRVFKQYWLKEEQVFINPYLNKLFNPKII